MSRFRAPWVGTGCGIAMHRRRFLTATAALAGAGLLSGHAPYRQWVVYRQTHLVILTSRDDPGADDLGEKCAAVMRTVLPESKAAVGRGPRVQRIASLIASRQAEVGIVSQANAAAMFHGEAPFGDIGAIPLRVLVQNDVYRMVCRDDFPRQHAYLIAEALAGSDAELGLVVPKQNEGDIPVHAGALAFASGVPLETGESR
ncbi:MAG: hypothetical protein K2Y35_06540 [Burkholderiales bacterium]|nr:hypothetical protein [Burkholderiales bacterium]